MKKNNVNKNIIWTIAFVNELAANGIKYACLSPGSRNTPLTFAFAKNKKIKKYVSIDERSSAFFALGLAKFKNEPVAIITTSGTATAELYPAIIEAYKQRISLIVCTADRPSGFFERGANQTINQINIYANHIRYFKNMGMPKISSNKISYLRKITFHALDIAINKNPGPVHFNFPFEKPFEPDNYTNKISADLMCIVNNKKTILFEKKLIKNFKLKNKNQFKYLIDKLNKTDKGIIIVGPENYKDDFHKNIFKLAKKLNYPILADGASQCRFNTHPKKNILTNYDAIFRSINFSSKHKPDIILHFGRTVTSKGLENYLSTLKCKKYLINEFLDVFDPSNNTTAIFKCLPSLFCVKLLSRIIKNKIKSDWLFDFIKADKIAENIKNKIITNANFPNESRVISEIINLIPNRSNIMLSNSMPIRDFDYFASNSKKNITIFNNRGASGVDGIISTANGIAEQSKRPTILITGDIAFYYDLNSLLQTKKNSNPLLIILINNNGGGIFRVLPISKYKNIFDKYFLTKHNLNFKKISKGFDIKHTVVKNWNKFRTNFNAAIISNHSNILEIQTDSNQSLNIRKEFWRKVREAI